jgi:arginine utilization protein RocB
MEYRSTEFSKIAPDYPDRHVNLRVPPVLEVREVLDAVGADASLEAKVFNILHNPKSFPDVRERIIAGLDSMLDSSHLTPPYAVVGFVPPYYPSSCTVDPGLREMVAKVVRHAEESYGIRIGMRNYYPYISDASFIAPRQGRAEAEVLMTNIAFADEVYDHDFALMRGLDCPAINVGPFGWDAHRKYERVERRYSFSVVPRMLESLIKLVGEG